MSFVFQSICKLFLPLSLVSEVEMSNPKHLVSIIYAVCHRFVLLSDLANEHLPFEVCSHCTAH